MKRLMIMGGLVGFLIGAGFGLVQGVAWPELFLRASVATLAAGLLLRWWGRVWVRSLKESYDQRLSPVPQSRPHSATTPRSK
jgi:ribose/xylose/arabinose/galactoside ABC-type transport system permease subunit